MKMQFALIASIVIGFLSPAANAGSGNGLITSMSVSNTASGPLFFIRVARTAAGPTCTAADTTLWVIDHKTPNGAEIASLAKIGYALGIQVAIVGIHECFPNQTGEIIGNFSLP